MDGNYEITVSTKGLSTQSRVRISAKSKISGNNQQEVGTYQAFFHKFISNTYVSWLRLTTRNWPGWIRKVVLCNFLGNKEFIISATYERNNLSVIGFQVGGGTTGFIKSEADQKLEGAKPSLLCDITSRPAYSCSASYYLKMDVVVNDKKSSLLDWKLSSFNNSVDMTLGFGGPLEKSLGQIETHIVKIEKGEESDKIHVKLDISQESKICGENTLSSEFTLYNEEFSCNTSAQIAGENFHLTQTIPKSTVLKDFQEDGQTLKNFTEITTLTTQYTDSFNNDVTLTIIRNYMQNVIVDRQHFILEKYVLQLDTPQVSSPASTEFLLGKVIDWSRSIVHDGLLFRMIGLRVSVEDIPDATFLYEVGFAESNMTDRNRFGLCRGNEKNVYSRESRNYSWKCLMWSQLLEIHISEYLDLLAEFSNKDPEEVTHELSVFIPKYEQKVNWTWTDLNRREFTSELYLQNIPYPGEEWWDTTEINWDSENRTIHLKSQLIQNSSGKESGWTTIGNGELAWVVWEGESTFKIVHTNPQLTNHTLDVLNNATVQRPYQLTNTLTVTIEKTGRTETFTPKKQLTWVVIFNNNRTSATGIDFYTKSNTTSDLKWEILSLPMPQEIYHTHHNFQLQSTTSYFEDVIFKASGNLKKMAKLKAGYFLYTSFKQDFDHLMHASSKEKNAGGSLSPATEFGWKVSAWLMDGEGEATLKTMFGNRFIIHLEPHGRHRGATCGINTHFRYLQIDNMTDVIVKDVQFEAREKIEFKDFLHLGVKHDTIFE